MAARISLQTGQEVFGKNARGYSEGRPAYPDRVYGILEQTCGAGAGTTAFEIGPGTGQATRPLLQLGCSVTAIEPDARLAALLAAQLQPHHPELVICRARFEEVVLPGSGFDLGIAAMSMHWLDPQTALTKVYHLLRPGGFWAMWWTIFGSPDDPDVFYRKTQPIFSRLAKSPSHHPATGKPVALDKASREAALQAAGFEAVFSEEISWSPILNRQQVLALTGSFSIVASLPAVQRRLVLEEVGRVVDELGGTVQRKFKTVIYTARKPVV